MTPMLLRIKALDQTKTAFKSVKAGLAGVTSSVLNMRNALVLVAGATGFGYLVKQSLNASDQLAKTASKIGTTTDALSKLHHASNLSGVSTDTMNMALQRFVRRTAEASKGTGEAVGALRELGINATDIQRLPLDKRMMVLSEAFANVSSQSDKLRLAFKLFDSEGAGLINMLNNGSDALGEMFTEAEDLGLVLEQMSANGVERANDSIYKLTSLARGLFMQFTASLAPAIESISKHFRIMFVESAKLRGGVKSVGDYLAIGFLDSLIAGLTGLEKFINASAVHINKLLALKRRLTGEETEQDKANRKYQEGVELLKELSKEHAEYANAGSLWDLFWDMRDVGVLKNSLKRLFDDIELPAYDDPEFQQKLESMVKDFESKISHVPEGFRANFSKVIELIRSAKGEIGNGSILPPLLPDNEIETVNKFKQTIEDIINKMPTLEDGFKSFTKGAMNSFTQGFTDAVTGAKNFGDAMKDMAKSVVDSLIKMLVQFYITQPLFNAIAGLGGGGGFQAGASSNSAMNYQGFDGMTGTVAYGGSVSAGQPYKVGENGEELFIPRANGAVVSNSDLNGGSGVVINQTINLSTGVAQTVKAEVMNMMPQIAKQTKSAVMDARIRGGSFSKSLVGA